MNNKNKRQDAITRLISTGNISSQDTLLALIRSEGFECTQATLSRDLHEMKVVKVPLENRGYVYELSTKIKVNEIKSKKKTHLPEGFLGMQVSGNILVINTLPGYASGIALAIDQAGIPELLGTIAGDDTILAVLKENVTKEEIKTVLGKSLPFFRNKI